MKPTIIDAHLHLDEKITGPAENAVKTLLEGLDTAGIHKGVLLHLETQRWPAEEVSRALAPHADRLCSFINIHPESNDAEGQLTRGIKELGFRGLKLHPRLQTYDIEGKEIRALIRHAGKLGAPVIIDAFPDGDWLRQGFSPLAFSHLAQDCPDTRIVIAHMGGHHVLDFMMLAKRIPNIFFDASFSLLYYRESAVPKNMIYAMRSMQFNRIFYGSDYPDRTIPETLQESLHIFKEEDVAPEGLNKILHTNAEAFFKWTD